MLPCTQARVTCLMVHPVLAVLQILDFFAAKQQRNPVQNGGEGIDALQDVQRVVGLRRGCWIVDMDALAVV